MGGPPNRVECEKEEGEGRFISEESCLKRTLSFPSRHPHCEVTPERPVEVGRVPNRGEVEGTSLRICTALKKCLGPLPKMGTGIMVGAGVAGRRA